MTSDWPDFCLTFNIRLNIDADIMFSLTKPISFLFLISYSLTNFAASSPTQPIASIQGAIRHFIDTEFKAAREFKYSLTHLDPRLKLPLCDQALQVFSQTGSLKPGHNSLGVHCNSAKKWTIYTVAQIQAFKQVVVVIQPLRRGTLIAKRHLALKSRDIADLRHGYLTNPELVVGKEAKRNLASGTVINSGLFVEPKIIKRGEKVSIEANSSYFNISMAGVALMDGSKGQNIRVKNIKSKRIIQATVVQPGQVSVD